MNFVLVILFAAVFPIAHILNGWVFKFAEISPHIGLIYLPAFIRLSNVLVLGRLSGTLANLLGGFLLIGYFSDTTRVAVLNSVCSAAGPLAALSLFKLHAKRDIELTSLQDLAWLTLIYAISNALLHHAMWSVLDPSKLVEPVQVLWMIVGDISGALLGAYLMKWTIITYRQCWRNSDLLD